MREVEASGYPLGYVLVESRILSPPGARGRARGAGRADRALGAALDERHAAARADGPPDPGRPGARPQHQPAAAAGDAPLPRRGPARAGARRPGPPPAPGLAGALRLRAGRVLARRARRARHVRARRLDQRPALAAAQTAPADPGRARLALGRADRGRTDPSAGHSTRAGATGPGARLRRTATRARAGARGPALARGGGEARPQLPRPGPSRARARRSCATRSPRTQRRAGRGGCWRSRSGARPASRRTSRSSSSTCWRASLPTRSCATRSRPTTAREAWRGGPSSSCDSCSRPIPATPPPGATSGSSRPGQRAAAAERASQRGGESTAPVAMPSACTASRSAPSVLVPPGQGKSSPSSTRT